MADDLRAEPTEALKKDRKRADRLAAWIKANPNHNHGDAIFAALFAVRATALADGVLGDVEREVGALAQAARNYLIDGSDENRRTLDRLAARSLTCDVVDFCPAPTGDEGRDSTRHAKSVANDEWPYESYCVGCGKEWPCKESDAD